MDHQHLPITALGIVLLAIGGLPLLLWGVFFRTVVGLHATWLVNSAIHIWGSRRFATRDDSTNNWLVALLTFGEGWHNNHHAHPTAARHGLRWYEADVNWYGIWMLKALGLAKQIKLARFGFGETLPADFDERLAFTIRSFRLGDLLSLELRPTTNSRLLG